jgi:hypothetical protein
MKKRYFAVLLILSVVLIGLIGCNPDTEGKTFYILYDGNGDDGGFPPIDRNFYSAGDKAVVKDKNTLRKNNLDFLYWNTKRDGNGVVYKEGEFITIENSNIRLYAIWGKKP